MPEVAARRKRVKPHGRTTRLPAHVQKLFDFEDSSEDSDPGGAESERMAVARHWGRVWKARAILKSPPSRSNHALVCRVM
jgi:hypothetical protein